MKDADGASETRVPKLMRRGQDEFLIYHPNAAADGRESRVDTTKTAGVVVDLSAARGNFAVEWYRTFDGMALDGSVVVDGSRIELRSPWIGHDVVLRLRRKDSSHPE